VAEPSDWLAMHSTDKRLNDALRQRVTELEAVIRVLNLNMMSVQKFTGQVKDECEEQRQRLAEAETDPAMCRLCHCCGDAPDRHGEILNVWVERAEQAEAALRERDARWAALEAWVADVSTVINIGTVQAKLRALSAPPVDAHEVEVGVPLAAAFTRGGCPRCAELEAENKRLTGLELERTVERDEARRFGEEAGQRYNALLIASCDVTCAFCGATYPRGTPRHGDGALADHIKVCLKHPMREAEAALRERDGRYHELLYAVGHKFPDESRHDTALRYIRQAEVPDGKQEGQMMSSLPAAETEGDTT